LKLSDFIFFFFFTTDVRFYWATIIFEIVGFWEFFWYWNESKIRTFSKCSHFHIYDILVSHYSMKLNKLWNSSCRRTKYYLTVTDSRILYLWSMFMNSDLTVTDSKILCYLWSMCKNYGKTCQKIMSESCVIPDFCHEVAENSTFLGSDIASSGNFLSTSRCIITQEYSSHIWITFIYKTKSMHKLQTYIKEWSFTTSVCWAYLCHP